MNPSGTDTSQLRIGRNGKKTLFLLQEYFFLLTGAFYLSHMVECDSSGTLEIVQTDGNLPDGYLAAFG